MRMTSCAVPPERPSQGSVEQKPNEAIEERMPRPKERAITNIDWAIISKSLLVFDRRRERRTNDRWPKVIVLRTKPLRFDEYRPRDASSSHHNHAAVEIISSNRRSKRGRRIV